MNALNKNTTENENIITNDNISSYNSNQAQRNAICIIPARLKSTRLPEKMLIKIKNKPLIIHTVDAVTKSNVFRDVIVATDDIKIQATVSEFGYKAVITSQHHTSGTSRVAEVVEKLNINAKVIVNVQGDEPLINSNDLSNLVDVFEKDNSIQMATLWYNLNEEDKNNPNVVKVVSNYYNFAIYFSRSLIPYKRNNIEYCYKKHIGVYAYTKDCLLKLVKLPASELEQIESLEQLRALYYNIPIKLVKASSDTIGVDTLEDIKKLENYLNSF